MGDTSSAAALATGPALVFDRGTVHVNPELNEGPVTLLSIDTPGREPTASLTPLSPVPGGMPRTALVEQWLMLTREILPAMAAEENWPIRFDHCFMRVCLDEAMGRPWTEVVQRPAIVTMSDAQLAAAVRMAESIVERPDTLPYLNDRSLRRRRAARRS